MIKQQTVTSWKKRIIYVSPFILGCFAQLSSAFEEHGQQPILTTSIERANNENTGEGERLYNEALKQLKEIEKTHHNDNLHDLKQNTQSYTDLLIQKISKLLQSNTDIIPAKTDSKPTHRNEFETITSMLEQSAREYKNNDALLLLAELNFFSKYTFPKNYRHAFDYYNELASKGNATAQQMIGFIYSTGVGNVVERDQAKSLLYNTFAAHGGDSAAEMTMGYRYLFGIGTDESCENALYHYKNAAHKVIDYYLSGPPGGHTPPLSKVRLSEEHGGVYGNGASATTEKKGRGSEKTVSVDEILQYWRYLASKQDLDAQLMLGQVYYLGTRNIPQNFKEALTFFNLIVDKYASGSKVPIKHAKIIGQAAGYLGLMHWRGEGVKVDEKIAHKWFVTGANLDDSISQNYLGLMYQSGVVVPKNREKAIDLFKRAAEHNPHAQVNLAMEYMQSEANIPLAIRWFTKAAESKHLVAYWYLALMNEQNLTPTPSCRIAVSYYKAIAERGDWLNPTVEDAYAAFKKNDRENALLNYMLAAERGYEVAQSNVGYMLDNDKRMLHKIPFIGSLLELDKEEEEHTDIIKGLDEKEVALIYWARSANQNNIDARVKLGDYYYKGIGTKVDYETAVSCYRLAAEMQASPLAFWNLGWMYENGIGVAKDFHLAKRSYDQALNLNQDAYLPVKLSVINMYVKYYWRWITGREAGSAFPPDEGNKFEKRVKSKGGSHMEGDKQYDIGEEMERQYKMKKQKEREEQERLGEEYNDDPYALNDLSEEDEFFESLLILALCLLVGYLVYVRQFRFNNQRINGFVPNPPNNRDTNNNNNPQ